MTTIVCGERGSGKSVETIRTIYEYIAGKPEKGIPGRKALIFDVNDEFGDFKFGGNDHHNIRAIAYADIVKYSMSKLTQVRRLRPYSDDGKRMTLNDMADALSVILEKYRNGLLLVEDINLYVNDNLPSDLIGSLATSRHIGLDIVIHFQSIGRAAHPKVIAMMNMIRLYKTGDSVSRHETKFQERTQILQIAEEIVRNKYLQGDRHYFLFVDMQNNKIRGKFTKDEALFAIHTYASYNEKKIIRPYMYQRDFKSGLKTHDEPSAYKAAREDLLKKYFAFK